MRPARTSTTSPQRFPDCRVFTAPINLGFGAGHNFLAGVTDAPYLLILNPGC